MHYKKPHTINRNNTAPQIFALVIQTFIPEGNKNTMYFPSAAFLSYSNGTGKMYL